MNVVTRFAPSPTGFLHIGGARTALFNWLYARHHEGKFLLRIEDTDRKRSTDEAINAILEGMKWLGLDWDDEPTFQFSRADRHKEIAQELINKGHAYHCYCTADELQQMREAAQKAGKGFRYDGRWRDRDPSEAPKDISPSVRIKAPQDGKLTIQDKVQGEVTVDCSELDDMVILRSDGTPTYMLAVVVDDHDMGVTQIIRGDDHLTNSFRQMMIYNAMGWDIPQYAHIPLIHGADGAKLSKRHGALGVEAYRDMGYLPEALRNYLLRLGWSHGDDEIISTQQAIEWFNLDSVGKSPSRFDFTKLENINGLYIRDADDAYLTDLVLSKLDNVDELGKSRILKGMSGLKTRAKTMVELTENAAFYAAKRPLSLNDKAKALLDKGGRDILRNLYPALESLSDWTQDAIQQFCRDFAETHNTKLGQVAQPLRAALSGSNISPSVFEVMEILEKEESLSRIKDAIDA